MMSAMSGRVTAARMIPAKTSQPLMDTDLGCLALAGAGSGAK
ncbi:hypothetical protein HNR07_000022 [Nocardiopsis metallicus]|uniref:Uncharacterized protein n=1 Tax=Nocardiopsis metallicus TaxID=179819 RepID=A0A840W9Y9_9ACTN|nr:hypothetical protein [Nocardiopsis metallicus]